MTEIAAKLLSNVTFDPFTKRAFTLAAGSVVKIIDRDLDTIRVEFAGRQRTISIDAAAPVEWDEDEEMWVEV